MLTRWRSDERGSATVMILGVIVTLSLLCGFIVQAAGAVIHRHQAQVGADMTAVTAAYYHAVGDEGCSRAAQLAPELHIQLESCEVHGEDAVVTTAVGFRWRKLQARSRAGPVGEQQSVEH